MNENFNVKTLLAYVAGIVVAGFAVFYLFKSTSACCAGEEEVGVFQDSISVDSLPSDSVQVESDTFMIE